MKKYADIPKENVEVLTPEDVEAHVASHPLPPRNTKPHKGFDGVGSWWGEPVHDAANSESEWA